jgi:hypothetical protein
MTPKCTGATRRDDQARCHLAEAAKIPPRRPETTPRAPSRRGRDLRIPEVGARPNLASELCSDCRLRTSPYLCRG